MSQAVFKRVEKKYMLDFAQYEAVRNGIREHMTPDVYGSYNISNIYFDTPDFAMIRASIEKPDYKEKIRLRSYGAVSEDGRVFLELKKKYDGVVYKRRAEMKLSEARDFLGLSSFRNITGNAADSVTTGNATCGESTSTDNQILRELKYSLGFYSPSPAAYISYRREAYAGTDNKELRLTFDTDLRGRDYKLDLKYPGYGDPIIDPSQILMEVKIPGAMPVWMCRLFSENGIVPVSFSKYGTWYKKYIMDPAYGRRPRAAA